MAETNAKTVAVTGTAFSKGGSILVWDSFESRTEGASLVGVRPEIAVGDWESPYNFNPDITNIYTTEQAYAGDQSYVQHIVSDNTGGPLGAEWKQPMVLNFGDTHPAHRVYLSFFHRYHREGDHARQVKMPRLSKLETYNEPAEVGLTHQDASGAGIFYGNYGEVAQEWTEHADVVDEWHRFEMTGDVLEGYGRYDRDLILEAEVFPPPLDSTPVGRLATTNVHQMNEDTSGVYDYFFDNLYLSDTWARVEIGNAATWDGCTARTVLPFTSWSDTRIDVTFDLDFVGFDGPYFLFVVNDEGTPSEGHPIS